MEERQGDRAWMARALVLARRGDLESAPNPRVGCVLVRGDQVVSEGWHDQCGGPHAEVNALDALSATEDRGGLTAYVTLEPCSHHGRTPPCADRLITEGVGRVVVGMTDPDPRVSGRGVQRLLHAGIQVTVFDHFPEGRWANRRFLSAMERQRPWVILKWAESADGFADPPRAPGQRGSLPITAPTLKALTHRWRAEEQAILVGAGTVVTDDPSLDVRDANGSSPIPVLVDPQGRTPAHARIHALHPQTVVVGGPDGLPASAERLPADLGLAGLLDALCRKDIRSVLVEGGPETHRRFLDAGLWDECRIATSPSPTGGGLRAASLTTESAILRGQHPFGRDSVAYWVRPESAEWAGCAPPPTLQIPLG